jgi:Cu(I)/Ag(I) efflux system membrane protein CusA/SilA
LTSLYWKQEGGGAATTSNGHDSDPNRRLTFRYDPVAVDEFRTYEGVPVRAPDGLPYKTRGKFERAPDGKLIRDPKGAPFRLWRPRLDPALNPGRQAWSGIQKPDDIWDEILTAANIPGTTSAPRLQPIAARIVMLQSGMRAPMGIKVKGPNLPVIEKFALDLERQLKKVPSIQPETVVADRIVGKPYLEIEIDRPAIARYGLHVQQVQDVIEVAIGGRHLSTSVEGRERYGIRVRYLRELRDSVEGLGGILVASPGGVQVPLRQVAKIQYVRGPQVIKSEDTRYVGYVVFDMKPGRAEVEVVEEAESFLKQQERDGQLMRPEGVEFTFAGSYENQIRAEKRLMIVLPLALLIIFLILYLQFRSVLTTLLVFSGVFVAWSGGFIMLGLYSWDGFLNFEVFGVHMRELFQIRAYNLSVAVWVGFLALFGIATDDGVIMGTYLKQHFEREKPDSIQAIREATVHAGKRRIQPALMTSATTILALIPVLTSTGRGADIMVPMAIPSFGGMTIVLITVFVVPTLYCLIEETKWRINRILRPPTDPHDSDKNDSSLPPHPEDRDPTGHSGAQGVVSEEKADSEESDESRDIPTEPNPPDPEDQFEIDEPLDRLPTSPENYCPNSDGLQQARKAHHHYIALLNA